MCCCLAARTVMAAFLPDYEHAISHTELQLNVEEVRLSCARYFLLHQPAWIIPLCLTGLEEGRLAA
jgi:hypothetical protein